VLDFIFILVGALHMSNREHGEPSLRVLSFTLRHRELWPKDFQHWNYAACDTCAMGLARDLWPEQIRDANSQDMMQAFGLNSCQASDIFMLLGSHHAGGAGNMGVSPEAVADKIDELLEAV
jgi:hypothetical protein